MVDGVLRPGLMVALAMLPMAGCEGRSFPGETGALPPTGIYELTLQTESDGCHPPGASGGMPRAGVFSENGVLSVPEYDTASSVVAIARVELEASSGYVQDAEKALCPDRSVRRQRTLLSATADRIEIQAIDTWSETPDAGDGGVCADMIPGRWPEAGCQSQRVLKYTLLEACESPCELFPNRLAPYEPLRCACP